MEPIKKAMINKLSNMNVELQLKEKYLVKLLLRRVQQHVMLCQQLKKLIRQSQLRLTVSLSISKQVPINVFNTSINYHQDKVPVKLPLLAIGDRNLLYGLPILISTKYGALQVQVFGKLTRMKSPNGNQW